MSDTEGMVRIMEHAADRLRAQTARWASLPDETIAAIAYGRAVLELVAASVAPEGRGLAERLRKEYHDWAAASDGIAMSDGELASVARFLTTETGS
jgi:hypothetical protein